MNNAQYVGAPEKGHPFCMGYIFTPYGTVVLAGCSDKMQSYMERFPICHGMVHHYCRQQGVMKDWQMFGRDHEEFSICYDRAYRLKSTNSQRKIVVIYHRKGGIREIVGTWRKLPSEALKVFKTVWDESHIHKKDMTWLRVYSEPCVKKKPTIWRKFFNRADCQYTLEEVRTVDVVKIHENAITIADIHVPDTKVYLYALLKLSSDRLSMETMTSDPEYFCNIIIDPDTEEWAYVDRWHLANWPRRFAISRSMYDKIKEKSHELI